MTKTFINNVKKVIFAKNISYEYLANYLNINNITFVKNIINCNKDIIIDEDFVTQLANAVGYKREELEREDFDILSLSSTKNVDDMIKDLNDLSNIVSEQYQETLKQTINILNTLKYKNVLD